MSSNNNQLTPDPQVPSASSSSTAPRRPGPTVQTVRFPQVYLEAKRQAAVDHRTSTLEKERQYAANPSLAPKKTLSKRARCNIKSAEICRAAKLLYIKFLEKAVLEEEQQQLVITEKLFKQTESNYLLRQKITQLQGKLDSISKQESWLPNEEQAQTVTPAPDQSHPTVSQFFLSLNSDMDTPQPNPVSPLDWVLDTAIEAGPMCAEVDIEQDCFFDRSDSESSSMEDIRMPLAAGTDLETVQSILASTAKLVEQTSPVSIFDRTPDVPQGNWLGPSIGYQ